VTQPPVGAIGLGLLGTALTTTLLDRGIPVVGYDPEPERRAEHEDRGGTSVASVGEVAAATDRILLSLPTSAIVADVCLGAGGIAESAAPGTVLMDTTTAAPADSIATGAALADRGIDFLDTSVSGSSKMAAERDIVIMVGGAETALDRVRPVLEAVARSVHHVGGPGAGARTKLIVNLALSAHRLVLAEALVVGERAGLDLPVLLEVLKDGAAYSKAMDGWGERMVAGDHAQPMSRIRQGAKDSRLILAEGRAVGAPTLVASVVAQVLLLAETEGLGDADNSAVIEVLRRLAANIPPGA
jgi:3-hydroxyisobutyrate dehydrogenase-like beta-hydroxyacid dehydrogenase